MYAPNSAGDSRFIARLTSIPPRRAPRATPPPQAPAAPRASARRGGQHAGDRAYDAARVLAAIRAQLTADPAVPTRNRKPLAGFIPQFEHELPVWELRVGELRVFYSIEEPAKLVLVWAVVAKGRKTTRELS